MRYFYLPICLLVGLLTLHPADLDCSFIVVDPPEPVIVEFGWIYFQDDPPPCLYCEYWKTKHYERKKKCGRPSKNLHGQLNHHALSTGNFKCGLKIRAVFLAFTPGRVRSSAPSSSTANSAVRALVAFGWILIRMHYGASSVKIGFGTGNLCSVSGMCIQYPLLKGRIYLWLKLSVLHRLQVN